MFFIFSIFISLIATGVYFWVGKKFLDGDLVITFVNLIYPTLFINLFVAVLLVWGMRYSGQDILVFIFSFDFSLLTSSFFLLFGGLLFFLFALFVHVSFFKKIDSSYSRSKRSHSFFTFFSIFSILLFVSVYWIAVNLPHDDPSAVLFSLVAPVKGSDTTLVFRSLYEIPMLFIFLFASCFLFVLPFKNFIYYKKNDILLPFFTLSFFALSILYFILLLNPVVYARQFEEGLSVPEHSEFYQTYYVDPDKIDFRFPDKKKNLIYILMESIESSFMSVEEGGLLDENSIPNLTRMAKENVNFSHNEKIGGGNDLPGTGWTIAAMVSKLAGIPLLFPFGINPEKDSLLLPNCITLNSVLDKAGYQQRFIFGSDKRFGYRDLFLEGHGNVEIHDINWYKDQGKLPQDYRVFWGFEDQKLYGFAQEELRALSANDKPFFLGILTVDTHFPSGYFCNLCPPVMADTPFSSAGKYSAKDQFTSVLKCGDRQIDDFLNWCKSQPWYEDTVVVIMGDHLFMNVVRDSIFPQRYEQPDKMDERRWLNIFINSQVKVNGSNKNRTFSSFDMFPTTLEAMGVTFGDSALGLGRSLFSGKPTVMEEFGEEEVAQELLKRSFEYDSFLFSRG